ncbi:hypothetical protein DB459_16975 [Bradyrhizobium sp. WD16]|nr:hypothetical protein DB459_16975 [Bradyrhizobium sp. WD16]
MASLVMAGLVPAIHVFIPRKAAKSWMPGTRPGMTTESVGGDRAAKVRGSERDPHCTLTEYWVTRFRG